MQVIQTEWTVLTHWCGRKPTHGDFSCFFLQHKADGPQHTPPGHKRHSSKNRRKRKTARPMRNAARIAMSSQPRAPASRGGVAGNPRKTTGSKMSMCVNLSQNICQSSKRVAMKMLIRLWVLPTWLLARTHARTHEHAYPLRVALNLQSFNF